MGCGASSGSAYEALSGPKVREPLSEEELLKLQTQALHRMLKQMLSASAPCIHRSQGMQQLKHGKKTQRRRKHIARSEPPSESQSVSMGGLSKSISSISDITVTLSV